MSDKPLSNEEVEEALQGLVDKGLVEWAYNENGEKIYRLTKEGQAVAFMIGAEEPIDPDESLN